MIDQSFFFFLGTIRLWQDAENRTLLSNFLKKSMEQVSFSLFTFVLILFLLSLTARKCCKNRTHLFGFVGERDKLKFFSCILFLSFLYYLSNQIERWALVMIYVWIVMFSLFCAYDVFLFLLLETQGSYS